MTSNHDKRDPDKVNPMLDALRSAKKNREARSKQLQAHLEKVFQKKVDEYIEWLRLPEKITEAVNQGKSSLDVGIRNTPASFASLADSSIVLAKPLTSKNDTFCYVEDKELRMIFKKTWTDFFKRLFSTVAVEELENSALIRREIIKIKAGKLDWSNGDNWDHPVREFRYNQTRTVIGPHQYKRGCCDLTESNGVHSEAYKYPDILRLRW